MQVKKYFLILGAVLLLIQLVPVSRTNPPERNPIQPPPEVETILSRSCYDCHSNKTQWPWYSRVAPLSWWIVDHVNEGREHLNFSEWGAMSPEDQSEAMEEAVEEVEEGEMPLPTYLPAHPQAELSTDDIRILREWAAGQTRGDHED